MTEQVTGSTNMLIVLSLNMTNFSSTANLAGTVVGCSAIGSTSSGSSGSGSGPSSTVAALSCPAGQGSGVNGIVFYSPTNYTSYQISTTSANTPVTSSLTWGVQYNNVNNLASGSYSGSLRAELWAVGSSYSGGTITGYKLGTYNPIFTGSGAYSANQAYVGAYSTTTVNSTGSFSTPPAGSYCVVATLEEYTSSAGGFGIDDWMQFSNPVQFK
jgi:hypothetical protein